MKQDVCDRCGRVIDPSIRPHNIFDQRVWYSRIVWRTKDNPYRDKTFDLCDKCSLALQEWIKGKDDSNG